MRHYDYSGDGAFDRLARRLDRHTDFRVLRRLPLPHEIWLAPTPAEGAATRLAIVDVETTGIHPAADRMIELAIVRMDLDDAGDLIDLQPAITQLESPGIPLSAEVEMLTGINDCMLAGHRFNDARVHALLHDVDVVVSHNAAFDSAFMRARFPDLSRPWACTLGDLDWRRFGLEGRSLGHLTMSAGHFMTESHRAGEDAWSLACLLSCAAPDGRAIAAHLIEQASRPSYRLFASGAPFYLRDVLRRAGYRWHPDRRCWSIEGDDERIASEAVFLRSLLPQIVPQTERVTWFNRYGG